MEPERIKLIESALGEIVTLHRVVVNNSMSYNEAETEASKHLDKHQITKDEILGFLKIKIT